MKSGRVAVICPTHRDRRELARLAANRKLDFVFHEYASETLEDLVAPTPGAGSIQDPDEEVGTILAVCERAPIDAVVSTDDYPGSALAAILAERLGLPGPPAAASLISQHKYYARLAQWEVVPEAVPAFELMDRESDSLPALFRDSPVFVKPCKSFFSVGAYPARTAGEWRAARQLATLPEAFFEPFDRLARRHAGLSISAKHLLVESLISGRQATLEGFCSGDDVYVLGVVDSLMHPGTISFERFEYPSELPGSVQERMQDVSQRLMKRLGYRDGFFNIEFFYDEGSDSLAIVEVNPRMSSQFADLFEKVDGVNSYSVLLDLALGREPRLLRRAGRHRVAASCVLRTFENLRVVRCPSERHVVGILLRHPDARVEILATEGRMLSQELQDGRSFRYGVINIGGRDRREIIGTLEECRRLLPYEFDEAAPESPLRAPTVEDLVAE
ncbi:MAG: ATP-grasp domain-containing protein [Acidobacteriota bacterium]|nr:ATP-grasp domain-containing protein [Acidobacteriota bacterium]